MSSREKGYETRSEVRVYQSIFHNALHDLKSGEYPSTGELCMDIASLGYAQSVAVDEIFAPRGWNMGIKDRLAARVCESCVLWLNCDRRVLGSIPMDEVDPFMVFESARSVSDEGINNPITRTSRHIPIK